MISDVRNKGAIPVLFTEAPRFLANEGTYESLEESGVTPYRDAMKIVAKQENVPFADVCTAMCDDEKNHTPAELRSFYADEGYNNRIHFTNKGADYVAQKIKEIARENNVEIVENKPVARMLYYNVDLDQEIPPELYQAVAEILAYVYGLKQG